MCVCVWISYAYNRHILRQTTKYFQNFVQMRRKFAPKNFDEELVKDFKS